jgi:large subunit ribosomal protein L24
VADWKTRIKKNDVVMVITGTDGGKTGKILEIVPQKKVALVEGIRLVKKCLRKSQERPQGGIADKEAPIAISNLLLYCGECKKGVKIKVERKDGRLLRKCKKCGHSLDG